MYKLNVLKKRTVLPISVLNRNRRIVTGLLFIQESPKYSGQPSRQPPQESQQKRPQRREIIMDPKPMRLACAATKAILFIWLPLTAQVTFEDAH